MSDARERMLAAVRKGLDRATLPRPPGLMPRGHESDGIPRGSDERRDDERSALVGQFSSALTALGGHAHVVADCGEAIALVASLFEQYHAPDFISWDADDIPCPGLLDALASRGLRRVPYDVPVDAAGRHAALAAIEPVGIGVTGALAAVAPSGTIVLTSGPGRGRLASLLPLVHVAVLGTADVYASLAEVVSAHPALATMGSHTVLITGPSRTADIEMTLTRGVHGPKFVHVVLIAERAT